MKQSIGLGPQDGVMFKQQPRKAKYRPPLHQKQSVYNQKGALVLADGKCESTCRGIAWHEQLPAWRAKDVDGGLCLSRSVAWGRVVILCDLFSLQSIAGERFKWTAAAWAVSVKAGVSPC